MKNIVIVGGSAGGATVAVNLRRYDEKSNITIVEKGPDVSFANCSLPYFFSGKISRINNLIVNTPEDLKSNHNIDVLVATEVTGINREEKTVEITDVLTKEVSHLEYDKLILSPGGESIWPDTLKAKNVSTLRNVEDVRYINDYILSNDVKSVAVVGSGYIGVELSESLAEGGYDVTLISSRNQILPILDEDMARILHKEAYDNGINLILGARASSLEDGVLILDNNEKVKADLYILAMGNRANTKLATDAGLLVGDTKGLLVDENMLTIDPDIYAIGDAVEINNKITGKKTMLQLAFPVHRQAGVVADHIYAATKGRVDVVGSSMLRLFDLGIGSTGLNTKMLDSLGYDYKTMRLTMGNVSMGDRSPIHLKVLYGPKGELYGAQGIGKQGVDKRIDIVASILFMGGTLEDLKNNERSYSPIYSTTQDITNVVADNALTEIEGRYKTIKIEDLKDLLEEDVFILDTRSTRAYDLAHIKGAVNIPHRELRSRLDELPKDRTIYTQSYNSYFVLYNNGYDVVNIQGRYEDIVNHYYYENKITPLDLLTNL